MNPKVIQAFLRSIGSAGKKIAKYNSQFPHKGKVRLPWWGFKGPVRSIAKAVSKGNMGRREFLQRSKRITDETLDLTKLSMNSQKLQERQNRANVFLLGNRKKAAIIDKAEKNRNRYIKTQYLKHELNLRKRLRKDSKFFKKIKKTTIHDIVGGQIDPEMTKEQIKNTYALLENMPKNEIIKEILDSTRSFSIDINAPNQVRHWLSPAFKKLAGINKFNPKNYASGNVIKKSKAKMNSILESSGVSNSFRKKLDREMTISKLGITGGISGSKSKLELAQTKLRDKLYNKYGHEYGTDSFIQDIAPDPRPSVKDIGIQSAFRNKPGGLLSYIERLTKEKAKENPLLQAFREGFYGE